MWHQKMLLCCEKHRARVLNPCMQRESDAELLDNGGKECDTGNHTSSVCKGNHTIAANMSLSSHPIVNCSFQFKKLQ
jgi:hypothetical protein